MTAADQINRMAEESQAGIREGFQGLSDLAKFKGQMDQQKASYAMERIEAINRIKDEVGVYLGEEVINQADGLKGRLKESIIKERKLGKVRFGKSIDMSALGAMNQDIDKLAKLARNSRVMDKVVEDGFDAIDSDKYIMDKAGAKQMLLRSVVDTDKLAAMDIQSMSSEIDKLLKSKSNTERVVEDVIGDVGMASSSYTKANGESKSFAHPSTMQMNPKTGDLTFTEGGDQLVNQAYQEAVSMGYNGSLEGIKSAMISKAQRQFVNKEGDPFWAEENRLSIAERKKRLAGEEEEDNSGIAIDALSRAVVDPTGWAKVPQAKRFMDIMKQSGIEFYRKEDKDGNVRLFTRGDVKDFYGNVIHSQNTPIDLSDGLGAQATVRAILERKMPKGFKKELDAMKDDVTGGLFFQNAWNQYESGSGRAEDITDVVPSLKTFEGNGKKDSQQPSDGKEKIIW
jgi:hypothetical protein